MERNLVDNNQTIPGIRFKYLLRTDADFYTKMGRFFGSRQAAKELGMPIYDDEDREWIVAIADDQVVGCSAIAFKKAVFELKSAYIEPAYRKQGIYTEMLQMRIAISKYRGAYGVKASCTPDREQAMLKAGFKPIGYKGKYPQFVMNFRDSNRENLADDQYF